MKARPPGANAMMMNANRPCAANPDEFGTVGEGQPLMPVGKPSPRPPARLSDSLAFGAHSSRSIAGAPMADFQSLTTFVMDAQLPWPDDAPADGVPLMVAAVNWL